MTQPMCGFRWRETPQPGEAATDQSFVWRTCTLPKGHSPNPVDHHDIAALQLVWRNVVGSPSGKYLEAEYKGMHCELFFNDRLGSVPMAAWDWSFYDDKSDDPDLAVARSDEGFPIARDAEEDLIDYIDGYVT